MQRFQILIALIFGVSACKGDDPLFLGTSVGKPLPALGTDHVIADLLPNTADVVCNFGPYLNDMPQAVPVQFRNTIADLGIIPTSEHEGYFVYLTELGTLIGVDRISYRANGYSWYVDSQNGRFRCREVENVKVVVREIYGRTSIYLTAR